MKYYLTQYYVPYRVAWIIPLVWGAFESFQSERFVVGVAMGFCCVLVWTTHYGFGIDKDARKYKDYFCILGLRMGQAEDFHKIEYLFANRNKLTQGGYFSSLSYSFQRDKYDGFIKFDGTNKIHLATRDDKKELMKVLNRIAVDLKITVVDYSAEGK